MSEADEYGILDCGSFLLYFQLIQFLKKLFEDFLEHSIFSILLVQIYVQFEYLFKRF